MYYRRGQMCACTVCEYLTSSPRTQTQVTLLTTGPSLCTPFVLSLVLPSLIPVWEWLSPLRPFLLLGRLRLEMPPHCIASYYLWFPVPVLSCFGDGLDEGVQSSS